MTEMNMATCRSVTTNLVGICQLCSLSSVVVTELISKLILVDYILY